MSSRWTIGEEAILRTMIQNGESYTAIANTLKRTYGSVDRKAASMGLSKSAHRIWTATDDKFIMDNYKKTMSATQIAEKLGVSKNAVIGRARRIGLHNPPEQAWILKTVTAKAKLEEDLAKKDGTPMSLHKPEQCLFGFGRKNGVHVFCCAPVKKGSAYCKEHDFLCYAK